MVKFGFWRLGAFVVSISVGCGMSFVVWHGVFIHAPVRWLGRAGVLFVLGMLAEVPLNGRYYFGGDC